MLVDSRVVAIMPVGRKTPIVPVITILLILHYLHDLPIFKASWVVSIEPNKLVLTQATPSRGFLAKRHNGDLNV
jgi:hypothetical protein